MSPWLEVVIAAAVILVVVAVVGGVRRGRPTDLLAEPPSDDRAMQLAREGRKIEAIKMVRELHGLGLKEAKDRVESALAGTAPVAFADPVTFDDPDAPGDEEIIAVALAGNKIEAIKMARQRYGMGLKDAKDWVDAAVERRGGIR